jgi:hypothetical protein
VPADAAARAELELVGLALVEDDHPLLVAEARNGGHRLFVVEGDGAEFSAPPERHARDRGRVHPEACEFRQ